MASSLLLFSSPLPLSSPKPHHLLSKTTRISHPLLLTKASKNSKNSSADPSDRIISAACYLYPFLDGVRYGRYVLIQFPLFQLPLQPLIPIIRLFISFPLNSFLLFLALYFAVVRNPSAFSRYVRFNTMQAIALDVLLISPDLIERGFSPRGGIGLDLDRIGSKIGTVIVPALTKSDCKTMKIWMATSAEDGASELEEKGDEVEGVVWSDATL